MEPCLYVKHESGSLVGLALVEVDDLILSFHPSERDWFVKEAQERFKFGKWKIRETEFAGRRVRQMSDGRILVDQEKYISENIAPMKLDSNNRSDKTRKLDKGEIHLYRSMCAQIQWVARESRPEVAGSASMLNSALPDPTVEHALVGIKVCKFLRSIASQVITILPLDLHSLNFVAVSDAGGPGTAKNDGSQGAWLVMAADASIRQNKRARVSILSWRSTRLKRAVSSTVAAETLSLSAALAEAQWLQVLFRDAVFQDVSVPNWQVTSGPFTAVLSSGCHLAEASDTVSVVDAKSVFDTLSKNTSGSEADRRNAIELAIIRDTMSTLGSQARWVPHGRMPADAMTKIDPARGNLALSEMLRRGSPCLMDEEGHLSERQLNLSLKSRSRKKCLEELLKSE